jgi:hypothetical protein
MLLILKEMAYIFSLKVSMDEEMARRSGKQPIPHKIAAEMCNKFKVPSGERP